MKMLSLNRYFSYIYAGLSVLLPIFWLMLDHSGTINILLLVFFLFTVLKDLIQKKTASPILTLCFTFLAFTLLTWLWHSNTVPADFFANKFPDKLLKFCLFFLIIAYSLKDKTSISPYALLITGGIGLTLHLIFNSPLTDWYDSLEGERLGFGFRNAQHTGVIFATALIAIICFTPHGAKQLQGSYKRLFLSWIAALLFATMWILITIKVRAVWLGLIIACLTCVVSIGVLNLNLYRKPQQTLLKVVASKRAWLSILCIAMLSLVSYYTMNDRVATDNVSLTALEDATHFEYNHLSSSNIRIFSWTAAIDWIEKRPLLGWGYRSADNLIKLDPRFSDPDWEQFGHLHNSYLEAAVSVGMIGLGLMLSITVMLIYQLWRTWQKNLLPPNVTLFACAFFPFWLVVNCFESYINYFSGYFITTIVYAFLFLHTIQRS